MTDWDDPEEVEIEEIEASGYQAPFQVTSIATLDALEEARERITSLISDEFLVEIYLAATMLRNICGDGDGFVADQANTIRSNALVLASEISKDPAELVIAVARSMTDPKARYDLITESIKKLARVQEFLAEKDSLRA